MTELDAASDPQVLLGGLVDGMARALKGSTDFEVERTRSLADRIAGRAGSITSLVLDGPDERLTLRLGRHDALEPEAARIVGGVVISRRRPALGEWLTAFAEQVAVIATARAGDAATAERALVALGVRSPAADVVIDEDDIDRGLAALPARVSGRMPASALAHVERIAALLRETLPRLDGELESRILVSRTATVYLPDTLRAYLALPADWAETHVLRDGRTPAVVLVEQLAALEAASTRMRDASLEKDAAELLANGGFLRDRFAPPSLGLG